ncbi:small secreted protein [Streptomyces zagrosensis]|uniref:Small secreted protein n=1 Tax=Streptomyces zagrosensis TaxID=1042984 RepID=A0A7W9QGG4_9ACTN|nr:small secreted protein [Streptomyces zagrosensis]MBB5939544.1 hypothetical protein [Streptomyces zagrosensis]
MNKKLVAALSGGAALVLALTGCGGDDDEGNKKAESWAERVCGDVQPQLKKMQEANASIKAAANEPDSKKLQQMDSQAFQQLSDAYRALGTSLKDAGAPPVDGGEKTQTEAVKGLNAASRAFSDLKISVDKLDVKNKSKFADGLHGVAAKLKKLSQTGNDALKQLEDGEVGEALGKQKGCQKPSGAASAPAVGDDKASEPASL